MNQPSPDIAVFEVKKEHSRGKPRVLHRNLLPFMGIPLSKHKLNSHYKRPSPEIVPLLNSGKGNHTSGISSQETNSSVSTSFFRKGRELPNC